MSKRKDPWSRGFVDRTPSPPSSDDGNDNPWEKGSFFSANRDNDLLAELDLSRREDHAVVRETPFSLARNRAQSRSTGATETPNEVRRSIRTAEDSMRPEDELFSIANPDQKERLDWRNHSGWLNAQGDPIPKPAPWIRKGALAKGTTTQIKTSQPTRKTNIEMTLSKPKAAKKPRAKKKAKAASPTDDKVEFHTLPPSAASNSDYPIVAALQRQNSLPRKTKKPRKQATAKSKRPEKTPPPVQKILDLDLLIRGGKKKGAVKRRPSDEDRCPTSPEIVTDIKATGSALKPLSAYAYSAASPVLGDLQTASNVKADVCAPPLFCPSSPPAQRAENTNDQEELLPTPPPSSESPVIYVPKPAKVATIAQLEEMAENGYNPAKQEDGRYQTRLSQERLVPRSPTLPLLSPATRLSTQQIPSTPFIEAATPPYDLSPPDIFYDQPSNSSRGISAAYTQRQYSYPQEVNPSHASYPVRKEAPHDRSAPSSRLSSQQSRPSSSRWAQLLPSASTEAEWSTLAPRRGRLTIPPKASAPKHSSFRLPIQMLEPQHRQQHQPHPDPAYHGPASTGNTVTKVTVWAPTPLRKSQASSQASTSEPSRRYVPPAMRPLQMASGPQHNHTQVVAHTQPSHEPEDDWTAAWARSVNIAVQR